MREKTIGEIAAFTGVSPHTIKYYEKIGLILAPRKENSNYRVYPVNTCTDIYECVKWRNLDFALKDTGFLLKAADDQRMHEMLVRQKEEIARQIGELQRRGRLLERYCREVEEMDARLGKWYIEELPEFYMKKQTNGMDYRTEAEAAVGDLKLGENGPVSKSVVCIGKNYLTGQRKDFSWGLGGFMDGEFQKEDISATPGIFRLPAGRAFVCYLGFEGHYVTNGEMPGRIAELFASYSGKEVPGDAYGVRIKITHGAAGQERHYMKVFIPLS